MTELPRGGNTVRGDHKSDELDYDQDENPPHSGREEEYGNRGEGALREGRERKGLGTKSEYIPVLQVLAES